MPAPQGKPNNQKEMTPQEYKDYERNQKIKPGKYKSVGKWVDNLYFHSTKEANYYGTLKLRMKAGDIKSFRRQVKFKITINGARITSYVCDFIIEMWDGTKQVIDVKSDFTRTLEPYRIKKNLMLALYGIKIIEV